MKRSRPAATKEGTEDDIEPPRKRQRRNPSAPLNLNGLFLSNLVSTASSEAIRPYLSEIGSIQSIVVFPVISDSVCATVLFDPAVVTIGDEALDYDGADILGRPVHIRRLQRHDYWIQLRGLPETFQSSQLCSILSEAGTVRSCVVRQKNRKLKRGKKQAESEEVREMLRVVGGGSVGAQRAKKSRLERLLEDDDDDIPSWRRPGKYWRIEFETFEGVREILKYNGADIYGQVVQIVYLSILSGS